MVNVSTKTGDKGKTGLANGIRMSKADPYFSAIGDLDELNSWIGIVVSHLDEKFKNEQEFLLYIQDQLFVLGAEVALAKKKKVEEKLLILVEEHCVRLQKKLKKDWHTKFLLPGGDPAAAWIDVARTVCRRAERSLVGLSNKQPIRPIILKILNRLSDYLYVLRCYINYETNYKEKEFGG